VYCFCPVSIDVGSMSTPTGSLLTHPLCTFVSLISALVSSSAGATQTIEPAGVGDREG